MGGVPGAPGLRPRVLWRRDGVRVEGAVGGGDVSDCDGAEGVGLGWLGLGGNAGCAGGGKGWSGFQVLTTCSVLRSIEWLVAVFGCE